VGLKLAGETDKDSFCRGQNGELRHTGCFFQKGRIGKIRCCIHHQTTPLKTFHFQRNRRFTAGFLCCKIMINGKRGKVKTVKLMGKIGKTDAPCSEGGGRWK